jgi:DNA-binding winged helix-turn-helix (wHTH) protein/Flp pilus assembly protein TadD
MQRILPTEYSFGPYSIKADEQVLYYRGRPVTVAPKVVATLAIFLAEPGRIISKAELMERIWPDGFVEDANLTQNVYLLRKMFEEHASGLRIENAPKRGYRLVGVDAPPAPLRPVAAAAAALHRAPLWRSRAAVSSVLGVAALAGVAAFTHPRGHSDPFALPPQAMQQYLLGRNELEQGTRPALLRSAAHFAVVQNAAPDSALGYAGLSESNTSLTFFTSDAAERAHDGAQAIALARRAVAVDGASAEAHAALGAVLTSLEHDAPAATRAFETALRLDPRNLDALVWYGTALLNDGRALEARTLFRRALAVDPSVPGSVASLAWADFLLRDYADAAAFAKQLIRAHRLETMARITLASADVQRGDISAAGPEIAALLRSPATRTQGVALRSQIDAMQGHSHEALRALRALEAQTNLDAASSWDILAVAAAYARLGRGDSAFVWLERVQASERQQLARDPRFDTLREDRRFAGWING